MSIQTLLNEEIKDELSSLKKMNLGSDEYKSTIDGLTKLMDRSIEFEKIDIDERNKVDEKDLKLKELDDDRKDKMIRNILTGAGIVIPTAVTIWGTIKSINFEKEGTITTIMGRGFIQKLLPRK